MKVAIVTNTSWNIYNFRMGLIKLLEEKGHKVVSIAPEDDFSNFLKNTTTYFPLKMNQKGSNPINDLSIIYQLYKIYSNEKPDVILHFTIKPNIYGAFAANLANVPCVNTVSGLGTVFLHKGLVSSLAKILYKLAFRYPAYIVFQNPDDRELFLQKKLVIKSKTILFPGSGVDIKKFKPEIKTVKNNFKFLLVARLLKDKGIVEYAEAAKFLKKEFKDVIFQLAGGLEDNTKLGIPQQQIYEWHEEGLIQYIGFQKDIAKILSEADCVVLPSYREGTPKSLLEAAAMGKPLLASRVPGCIEVVKDGVNGFLFEAKNPMDFADKMKQILQSPSELLETMGRNSRKLVEERFSEEIVTDKYLKLLENLKG